MNDAWIGGVYISTERLPPKKFQELKRLADSIEVKKYPNYVIIGKFYDISKFLEFVGNKYHEEIPNVNISNKQISQKIVINDMFNDLHGEVSVEFHRYFFNIDEEKTGKKFLDYLIKNTEKYVGKDITIYVRVEEKVDRQRVSLDALRIMIDELFKKHSITINEFNEILKEKLSENIDITARNKSDYNKYYETPYLIIKSFCEYYKIRDIYVCDIRKEVKTVNGKKATVIEFRSNYDKDSFIQLFIKWLMKNQKF